MKFYRMLNGLRYLIDPDARKNSCCGKIFLTAYKYLWYNQRRVVTIREGFDYQVLFVTNNLKHCSPDIDYRSILRGRPATGVIAVDKLMEVEGHHLLIQFPLMDELYLQINNGVAESCKK